MSLDSPELTPAATEITGETTEPKNVVLTLDRVTLERPEAERPLLNGVNLDVAEGQFVAIVGPSGCGKSTLLKLIAGIEDPTDGSIYWHGRDVLHEADLEPQDLGYVPQFSIAYEQLTVDECVENAISLRVAGLDQFERDDLIDRVLADVGLSEIADRRVSVLSGGQKRRLALAMELVTEPTLMLCDEVTSGLDPKSEDEIVELLRKLSRENNRIVLSVTHSLRHLALYDSVVVLSEGRVAYHGPAGYLLHYFDVTQAEDVFSRLSLRGGERWAQSWSKHRAAYYAQMFGKEMAEQKPQQHDLGMESATAEPDKESKKVSLKKRKTKLSKADARRRRREEREERSRREKELDSEIVEREEKSRKEEPEEETEAALPRVKTPGLFSQMATLTKRRFTLFFRDAGQVWLQLAMLLGFPCIVAIFAMNGLPQIKNLTTGVDVNVIVQLMEAIEQAKQSAEVGSLVSGIVMFQVILLTLMGSNNSAREIAAERPIYEKEKLGGVQPAAYLFSKFFFLTVLVAVQSLWMGLFIHLVCRFPGNLGQQLMFLVLVNGAMTAVCLGISSLARTPEQASLLSIYLVGFQLPLSGAVLALPEPLGAITRPVIAAYWSWSGYLQTMVNTRFYDVVKDVAQTVFSGSALCLWVLGSHILIGMILAYIGASKSRWS